MLSGVACESVDVDQCVLIGKEEKGIDVWSSRSWSAYSRVELERS